MFGEHDSTAFFILFRISLDRAPKTYFVGLFHSSERCRTKQRMTEVLGPGEKRDIILTLSDFSTKFHTSEKCRTK